MSKSIKLVQAKEGDYFIGVANEETRTVTPLIFLGKSSFISNATYNEILSKVKIVVEEGYIPTVKEN